MLKERRAAVEAVAASFLCVEAAAQQAAIGGAQCITVMIEERSKANLPADVAAEEMEMLAEGVLMSVRAYAQMTRLHARMRLLPKKIGVHAYGTEGSCPPNEPFTSATEDVGLRVVA